ncbi:MAG: RNA polymerase sigma factor [Candidatus Aminicenantales bacterium]
MEEREILERCLHGDEHALRMIVDMYRTQAMAVAMNILRNHEDAEDACQEAFIQAFRSLERFDRRRSFKKWFLTILYRRCLDRLRRKKRFARFFSRFRAEVSLSHSDEDRKVAKEEKGAFPKNSLESLSPKERAALTLWAFEDCTAEEISEILGCRPSTARVYLFNARKKLKSILEKKHV